VLLDSRARWALLILASLLVSTALEALHLPAALLLGPLIAAVAMAVARAMPRVPVPAFLLAQAVIGCMIARAIPASTLPEIVRDWPIFLAGIVSVLAASSLVGWVLMRWQILPGTTAIWGTSPGASQTMILMAESYGADMRLVAFMQYLRLVFVALVATAVARIWVGAEGGAVAAVDWFPPLHAPAFGATLLLVAGTAVIGRYSRLPAGSVLVALVIGTALNTTGLMTIELPPWFLACAYALSGWQIGARFDRAILWHSAKVLPQLLAANLALVALCGLLAGGLVLVAGVDPLTAYLATSPGGSDTVAIIAASSQVDLPFIMAMQTARMFLVILTGPWVARKLADAEQRRLRARGS
jgi:membrane AbrB-like protein